MKRLLSDSLNVKDMFFDCPNIDILLYLESQRDNLGLNEAHSCKFRQWGNTIEILGDEDLQEIEIETILPIKTFV